MKTDKQQQQRADEIRERYIAFFMQDRNWTRKEAKAHAASYGWDWMALAEKGLGSGPDSA